jgi:uncharacterized protein (TIGR03086 family)
MTDADLLASFDRAAVACSSVIAHVTAAQMDDPTPCPEWSVRQLLNHVIGGTKMFASMQTGEGPVDRAADHVGGDPAAAFQTTVAHLRDVFAAPGALDRVVAGPFGEQPARVLVIMRTSEMMVHGWDLAKATGQSTDLDAEVAEECIESFRRLRASGRGAGVFADAQPVPDDALAADRLAAIAGRAVR